MDLDALEAAWKKATHNEPSPYFDEIELGVLDEMFGTSDAAAIFAIMNAAGPLIALARAGQNMRVIVRRESCSLEPDGEALTTALRAYDAATKGGG